MDKKKPNTFINILLSLSFVSTITYFIFTVINSQHDINQLATIISTLIMTLFSIFFIFIAMTINLDNKKANKFVIIASILLTCYSSFNILVSADILKLPKQKYVENFTNRAMVDAIKWAKENNVSIEQVYETSDTVTAYHIISQDIEPGTLVKEVDKLTITVSEGPNLEKELVIPNMLGWKVDDVLAFIKNNHLTNVEVDFIISAEPKDTVINQEGSGVMRRNDLIKLTFSIGNYEDIKPIAMIDLSNKSLFEATFWLKQHGFKYELAYDYHDTIDKDKVISQDKTVKTVVDPNNEVIKLVISKGPKIIVPDLLTMSIEDITNWVTKYKLKIEFTDRYDDTIKLGMPIDANYKKDDVIEQGTLIKVVISKGTLKMEKFDKLQDFKNWALKYNISYQENYEFNDEVELGDIIKFSHKEGEVIKNNDTVSVLISQGKAVKVPNFVGKTKSKIEAECKGLGIICTFSYGGYSDSIAKDVAIKQSSSEGSKIVSGTTISIILSKGAQKKVTVPSFIGQNQTTITNKCNDLGLVCTFTTDTAFGGTKGLAKSQSIMNQTVVVGTKVSIVLSRGEAHSYTVNITDQEISLQDPSGTYNKLLASLNRQCPGGIFNLVYQSSNTGTKGMLHPNSPYGVGSRTSFTCIEGQTYTFWIIK